MTTATAAETKKDDKNPPLENIMEYYRKRVDEVQKEREDWFEQLEKLRISQEDFHKIEWELKKRNEEIADLQKTLCEAKVALFEEREQMLLLKREVADLKALSIEDRNKILRLIAASAKEEEDKYYFKEIPPQAGIIEVKIKNNIIAQLHPKLLPVPTNEESLAIPRAKHGGVLNTAAVKHSSHKKKHKRHVNIKEDYVQSLLKEIEDLKALNDQQKTQYETEIIVLKEDRRTRENHLQTDSKNCILQE